MNNKSSLAIFTEASNRIGIGHLIESLNLAKLAKTKGLRVDFWVRKNSPIAILNKIPFSYNTFTNTKEIKETIKLNKFCTAVFNFRKIDNSFLNCLNNNGFNTICIDELGRRRLDCDILINPMIVDKYHRYPTYNRKTKFYKGASYLSMSTMLVKAQKKKRVFKGNIKEISVCMGGADRSGATLNIIDALRQWRKDVKKNIIIGPAFSFINKIKEMEPELKNINFRIYYNVTNVIPIFLKSDVVFTAGGNTLYELACLGTPAIVLYEDAHEKENGIAFEKLRFGICPGKGTRVKKKTILLTLDKFEDHLFRTAQSVKGKKLVDGKGTERILNIINGLTK